MQKSQVNRAVVAARASARPVSRNRSGMYVGPLTHVSPAGFSGRKGRRPGADKGQKGWDRSPYYKTGVTIDARWSA